MILEARDLYRFFHTGDDEVIALRGVGLTVLPGVIVAVMGPSGSGKSTLLNCLTGLDEPDAGLVTIGGARLSRQPEAARAAIRARSLGILMQSGNLFAHLSLTENIRLQMQLGGVHDTSRPEALLDSVGLAHRGFARVTQLSGGETARAGLTVALACNPPILIADEPTAEVDAATEVRLIAQFEARRAAGQATLIATHSEALARRADRILRLKDGAISHE
jgi:putative ABC transport system ATP-binding protein